MSDLEVGTSDGAGWWEWLGVRPRRGGGALSEVMADLVMWLRGSGYAVTTSRNVVRAGLRLGEWMTREGLTLENVDARVIAGLIRQDNAEHPCHRVSNESASAVVGFLESAGLIRISPAPADRQTAARICLDQWCACLAARDYGSSWVAKARRWVGPFLALLDEGVNGLCWQRVDATLANDYISTFTRDYSASTCQCVTTLVRHLLRWAYMEGLTPRDESIGVLSVRRSPRRLPRGIPPDQVEALKASIDASTELGKRDLAIIVALSRLGLRVGELAGLTLDDIDWREPCLSVTGKGGRLLELPIPVDVGEALVDYLRHRRSMPGERRVFLRVTAPQGPLHRTGITALVAARAEAAGLVGVFAHRLRHGAATQILTHGGGLEEVRQLLGHAQLASSLSYARLDVEPMRALAPAWKCLP
jgi:site-specific recombinase XerD